MPLNGRLFKKKKNSIQAHMLIVLNDQTIHAMACISTKHIWIHIVSNELLKCASNPIYPVVNSYPAILKPMRLSLYIFLFLYLFSFCSSVVSFSMWNKRHCSIPFKNIKLYICYARLMPHCTFFIWLIVCCCCFCFCSYISRDCWTICVDYSVFFSCFPFHLSLI